MIKKCLWCGGKVVTQKVNERYNWKRKHLVIITDVPAEVCQLCGESYIEGDVMRRMDEIAQPIIQAAQKKPVNGPLAIVPYVALSEKVAS